jgi:hypothetical protein
MWGRSSRYQFFRISHTEIGVISTIEISYISFYLEYLNSVCTNYFSLVKFQQSWNIRDFSWNVHANGNDKRLNGQERSRPNAETLWNESKLFTLTFQKRKNNCIILDIIENKLKTWKTVLFRLLADQKLVYLRY